MEKFAKAYKLTTSQLMYFYEEYQEKNLTYRQTLIMILKYYIEYENDFEKESEKQKIK